jgi:hypothetical protein
MGEGECCFGENEAEEWVVRFESAAIRVVDEVVVIGLWIVSREAESESAFASEGSVATSGVAVAFREDGEDVPMKAWGIVARRIPDGDGYGRGGGVVFEADFR